MNTATEPQAPKLFDNRNFRWVIAGSAVSMVGDQFTSLALPWLVLMLTGDPLALGLVVAAIGVPIAVFCLIGGAIVDRFSASHILMITRTANALLLCLLAIAVWTGGIAPWMIYCFALGLGISTAFASPAGNSLLPQIVAPELLQAANGAVMGLRQLITLVGPVAVGLLITVPSGNARIGITDHVGIAMSFAIDAVTFIFAVFCIWKIRQQVKVPIRSNETIAESIGISLKLFWSDQSLRTLCLYMAAIACFVSGPIAVALPLLVSTRLPGGAASLGLLITVHGFGSLLGMGVASAKPQWRIRNLGLTMLVFDAISGFLIMPLGAVNSQWQCLGLLFFLGAIAGFAQVVAFSWIQKRVKLELMGRFTSIFMFLMLGLSPVSASVAGALLKLISLPLFFELSGICLLIIAAMGAFFTSIKQLDDAP